MKTQLSLDGIEMIRQRGFRGEFLRRAIAWVVGILALLVLCLFIKWSSRASLMEFIHREGMVLQAEETDISNWDAQLYEWIYSSPVGADKLGLMFEANQAKHFQLFASNGKKITPEILQRLRGWPLQRCREIDLSNSELTDDILRKMGKLSSAEWIDLSGTGISDQAVPEIVRMAPRLTQLELRKTAVSGSKLNHLSKLAKPELLELDLGFSGLSDEGLAILTSAVPRLRSLKIAGTGVSNQTLPSLASFQEIRKLDVSRTNLPPDQLASHLPASLQQLDADGMAWSREALARLLAACPNLVHLDLGTQSTTTSEILAELAKSQNLSWIGLGDTPIGVKDAEVILSMNNLRILSLGEKSCTPVIQALFESSEKNLIQETTY